ncbi:MAG: UpxY family transcription antiterminator [Chlorobi bacterium]|nr:UpxY family transcription antiterminator [Chlorobiota bacterium]
MLKMKKWFALYTKPRHEFKALEQITAFDITTYLPTTTVIRQWSDRKKKITEPLFKSYIFINADELERNQALTSDAVLKTIFFNGKPAVIPDWEIENLKQILNNADKVTVFNGIVKGTKVEIGSGPMMGLEGVVSKVSKNEQTLAVSIEMLNRSVIVTLPASTVIKKSK